MKQLAHEVRTPESVVFPAHSWCEQQWGERWGVTHNREGTWSVFWAGRDDPDQYRWCFATQQQVLLFTLRWGRS